MDDESISIDISVWSQSARSNNIKSINKPEVEKLDLNILTCIY